MGHTNSHQFGDCGFEVDYCPKCQGQLRPRVKTAGSAATSRDTAHEPGQPYTLKESNARIRQRDSEYEARECASLEARLETLDRNVKPRIEPPTASTVSIAAPIAAPIAIPPVTPTVTPTVTPAVAPAVAPTVTPAVTPAVAPTATPAVTLSAELVTKLVALQHATAP